MTLNANSISIWNADDWHFMPLPIVYDAIAKACQERNIFARSGRYPLSELDTFEQTAPFWIQSISRKLNQYVTGQSLRDEYSDIDAFGEPVPNFGYHLSDASSFANYVRQDNRYLLADCDLRAAKALQELIRAMRWRKTRCGVTYKTYYASKSFSNGESLNEIWQWFRSDISSKIKTQPSTYAADDHSFFGVKVTEAYTIGQQTHFYISVWIPCGFEVNSSDFATDFDLTNALCYLKPEMVSPGTNWYWGGSEQIQGDCYFWNLEQGFVAGQPKQFTVDENGKMANYDTPSFDDAIFTTALDHALSSRKNVYVGCGFNRPFWDLQPCFKYK